MTSKTPGKPIIGVWAVFFFLLSVFLLRMTNVLCSTLSGVRTSDLPHRRRRRKPFRKEVNDLLAVGLHVFQGQANAATASLAPPTVTSPLVTPASG